MNLKLYDLTKEQEGLWLDYCIYPESYFYNASFFVKIKGELNVEHFIKCDDIVKNHFYSIGRVRFKVVNGVPYQYLVETAGSEHFEYIDLTKENQYKGTPESILTEKNRVPFKLEFETSVRSILIKYSDNIFYYAFIQP